MLGLTALTVLRTRRNLNFSTTYRLLYDQSWISVPLNPPMNWPVQSQHAKTQPMLQPPSTSFQQHCQPQEQTDHQRENPDSNLFQKDCATICNLLRDPNLSAGPTFEAALNQTGIKPSPILLEAIFNHLDYSPKPLYTLFRWAEHQPSYCSTTPVFNSMIDILAKAREFDLVWSLMLECLNSNVNPSLISSDTFAILMRRYARADMPQASIRTFEFAHKSDTVHRLDLNLDLFDVLLDSLCKEGHARIASAYLDQRKQLEPGWIPTIRVYNILLNGWFRSRKLKQAERLWEVMRKENVAPTVVTYGTIIEGYCRMRRVDQAIELIGEMRREGIEPNDIVCNPIIDALSEAGRFKEALAMMERLSISDSGPTVSTYNSLVKGYCKAGDLVRASKTLKMMIGRGFVPTPTTYNYFFRHFSRFGKIEEGMNLYTKMTESGYVPDRLTYHLLIKMLCEQGRLDLAVQVRKEMMVRGFDSDLATSTMLVHLLCRLHRFEEAGEEFEDMIRRGIVPQYLTYRKLVEELKKSGMTEIARRISARMASIPHSKKLPDRYKEGTDGSHEFRSSIMRRAQAMSDILKTCKDPRKLRKLRCSSNNVVESANILVEDIKRRINGT
ncbi:PREDICTED: pentatricopeptide repeat-containing protein At5g11310, mitochondrial isoform X1 [Nelumbo nucifera]|uniref:Pentatricopeptide repeat-containing protein At5g11310, mitochondrial isoform X1 n=2 Tax=Nelumbo nucifera TaxID=4432 RepID=A0A1U7ZYG8_NELNU|nr:PREDICTED: pentatricopeptide repeat-containing protein At5g11310, mitochondrial isoform X1 [Nelumbo nucifera]DAD27017.1 TPA_asm: hypothetical protein HUJ06_028485 [Nelumbo nucifera]